MATIFLEPGGDAEFGTALWPAIGANTPLVVTDIVHGRHIKSIQYQPNLGSYFLGTNLAAQAGGRVSAWIYLVALPTSYSAGIIGVELTGDGAVVCFIEVGTDGVLRLTNPDSQMGSNGATLSTGVWYRISLAWTITSETVNQFRVYVNGASSISVSNLTVPNIAAQDVIIGNNYAEPTLDFRSSDHYIDNSTALTDPGNIWVTAKRPYSNGLNQFTTQIGSGGSGYPASGGGHAPQVNERPNNDADGWSMVGIGNNVTEKYNIEKQNVGDIGVLNSTIVDWMGWVRAKSLIAETAEMILDGATWNINLTSTTAFFTQIAGNTTYPSGTNSDIGIQTSTTVTTVSLYECGVVVAYIPATSGVAEYLQGSISQPIIANDIQLA